MSKFAKFMKANKIVKANEMHAVTKSLCDEIGQPLEWEFRHITSKENEAIQQACTKEVPVSGKPALYRSQMDYSEYTRRLIVASVVMPDLFDAELQDSYGVKKEGDLLMAMVDDPGEYNDLATYVQKLQGFKAFEEEVKEAKN